MIKMMGRGQNYTFRETAINNKAAVGKFSFEICVLVCNKSTYPTFSNALDMPLQNLQPNTEDIIVDRYRDI